MADDNRLTDDELRGLLRSVLADRPDREERIEAAVKARTVALDPRSIACPACFAPPGEPCNVPTDEGRRNVSWYHLTREGRSEPPRG